MNITNEGYIAFASNWVQQRPDLDFASCLNDFHRFEEANNGYLTADNFCEAFDCSTDELQNYLKKISQTSQAKPLPKISATSPIVTGQQLVVFLQDQIDIHHWTQKQLGDKIGMNYAAIRHFLSNPPQKPRAQTLDKICTAFNVTLGDIQNFQPTPIKTITGQQLVVFLQNQIDINHWTHKQLGDKIGMNYSRMTKLLSNPPQKPRAQTLDKICTAFNVTLGDINIMAPKPIADIYGTNSYSYTGLNDFRLRDIFHFKQNAKSISTSQIGQCIEYRNITATFRAYCQERRLELSLPLSENCLSDLRLTI